MIGSQITPLFIDVSNHSIDELFFTFNG